MANTANTDSRSVMRVKNHTARHLIGMAKRPKVRLVIIGVIIVAIILMVMAFIHAQQGDSSRSETYKKVTGSAGLSAAIDYDCKQSCDGKYDFNVYMFKDDGQQIGVVRPDKDGKVNMALAEGNYVMVIGKQFGNATIFPQEPLALKNGQSLELKLHYK